MKVIVVSFLVGMLLSTSVKAAPEMLDSVSVIVDQGVVLESQIEELVASVKRNAIANNQTLPSDRALRTQAIERLIIDSLQMQMADRMGIQISDPQLDQTITNIAQGDNLTLAQLRDKIAEEGVSYEVYREEIRKELIVGEVRRANVRRRIYITPQEIENLVKLIDEQGGKEAEYRLGHILIAFPSDPTDEDIEKAKGTAEKVIELLNSGSDFAKIATASSSGANALEGGDMGWMNINSMPTLFAEAVQNRSKDELIGPIRSGAGFHILKVVDTRGIEKVEVTELNSRHILIKPSVILSDEKAVQMLKDFRAKILSGEADFATLAKEHSADPGSALKGGELGWADPNVYVPEFKDTLNKLDINEISQPVRSVHGWHLMQLLDKRVGDATEKLKEDKAYQLLFQRKFSEETDAWLREIRASAYIEVLAKKES
ncbi:MAG: peptidylprolyl isomerase SurA [Paraglaciecola sp.]|uniref:peptidylprolyl isomerase SurA n=1 Tax=Pseudomonadati TaxID=3379134 RepID=UPI00273FE9B9|nr:peptidylprolyl isomerase SurA [Paraglaciecola sp.]MDP5032338.1 peptidylprolyl isomerase SurA [Paraglaciecola sp.]MDP5041076.1 peptidylprolyl isomerase SurA [Paraglaciecola sp.]MDP5133202.1 peptidylprolyl isomerase SurA [Paraglaciecola sp.]